MSKKYWLYSPGENARMWDDCLTSKIMSIGWDELGDLSSYITRDAIKDRLVELYGPGNKYTNDSLATWQFANEIQVGDIVFAKRGRNCIIGMGTVRSLYRHEDSRKEYKNTIDVEWTDYGEWPTEDYAPTKTLTEITPYLDYIKRLTTLVQQNEFVQESCNYWWLCANPKVWSMSEWVVGEEQDYTLFNENGNKRRIFANFKNAKTGDKVICYEATPTKQILGLAIVSKESDDSRIYFEKLETFTTPIDLSEIKACKELEEMEFFANSNGSFFKLTKNEYNIILDLIRENNPGYGRNTYYEDYTKENFLNEVYMSREDLDSLENLLINKKNIILQGAPGVGKTFSARRLAYQMMGQKDKSRVCLIQFHQNYSYEDFIMGYKPSGSDFVLQRGVFYKFCINAANNPDKDYFFIIDEINRGNLSKIFGELLMLIEKDYRETKLTLAYKDERFYVPENVYIIGMMNTADRSLAIIDYALRRRFSFYHMKPGFDTKGFKKYAHELNNEHFNRLIDKIKELNKKILFDDSLGEGFEIGHSYFCGQTEITDAWLHQVINYDIIPMLQEYWFDNKREVENWRSKLNEIFND
jgi:5-methylcytosine-specific restriction protein B